MLFLSGCTPCTRRTRGSKSNGSLEKDLVGSIDEQWSRPGTAYRDHNLDRPTRRGRRPPGSNRLHYDHMHVELMRRRSGPRHLSARRGLRRNRRRRAARGKYAREGDPAITGSITSYAAKSDEGRAGDDDWVEHDGPRGRVE